MKTPEEILKPYIESFTGNGDYYFQYVDISSAVLAMTEYADQFRNPPKKSIEDRKYIFRKKCEEIIGNPVCFNDTTIAFFDYWTEHSEGAKKMRFEKEKVFDIKKRLDRWKRNQKTSYGKSTKPSTDEAVNGFISQ